MSGEKDNGTRLSIVTFGCRLNQAEEGLLTDRALSLGYHVVPWGEQADVYVINSCTVTVAAVRKSRQAVRRARRQHRGSVIAVVGCSATTDGDQWRMMPEVDIVVANPAKTRVLDVLAAYDRERDGRVCLGGRFPPAGSLFTETGCSRCLGRTRAHLKIQEGCSFFCSFCIVPYARGPARSRVYDDILREADELVSRGYRELVLTGVNIATYSCEGKTLPDLLSALATRYDGVRIRLSSSEPGEILDDVIDVMAIHDSICRFLHVPLQYGHDDILAAMNRRYTLAAYARMVEKAARQIPGICIGSDIVVGFPGETDALFDLCLDTVTRLPIHHLHVFRYSPRAGTPAGRMKGRVKGPVVAERHRRMTAAAAAKAEHFVREQVGRDVDVLVETQDASGRWRGWSDNYLDVYGQDSGGTDLVGRLIKARITGARRGRSVNGVRVTEHGR